MSFTPPRTIIDTLRPAGTTFDVHALWVSRAVLDVTDEADHWTRDGCHADDGVFRGDFGALKGACRIRTIRSVSSPKQPYQEWRSGRGGDALEADFGVVSETRHCRGATA
jgi:hypothetical protein